MELSAESVARPARDAGSAPRAVSLEQFIGLPWQDHGRSFAGVDCWGLVRLRLRHGYGVEVPSYGEISARELAVVSRTIRDAAAADPWVEIDKNATRRGDVVLMRGRPLHVGLVEINRGALHVLHVEDRADSVLVPIKSESIAFRIMGFRRHKLLMET